VSGDARMFEPDEGEQKYASGQMKRTFFPSSFFTAVLQVIFVRSLSSRNASTSLLSTPLSFLAPVCTLLFQSFLSSNSVHL
jgi:hypothetical protein